MKSETYNHSGELWQRTVGTDSFLLAIRRYTEHARKQWSTSFSNPNPHTCLLTFVASKKTLIVDVDMTEIRNAREPDLDHWKRIS